MQLITGDVQKRNLLNSVMYNHKCNCENRRYDFRCTYFRVNRMCTYATNKR